MSDEVITMTLKGTIGTMLMIDKGLSFQDATEAAERILAAVAEALTSEAAVEAAASSPYGSGWRYLDATRQQDDRDFALDGITAALAAVGVKGDADA